MLVTPSGGRGYGAVHALRPGASFVCLYPTKLSLPVFSRKSPGRFPRGGRRACGQVDDGKLKSSVGLGAFGRHPTRTLQYASHTRRWHHV